MIKQECIGIPDMILLLTIFLFQKKIKIKAEIVLSPGGAYFIHSERTRERTLEIFRGCFEFRCTYSLWLKVALSNHVGEVIFTAVVEAIGIL